jgi:hypothetical protein
VVQPLTPSINLLPGAEVIEQEITETYQAVLAQQYGIDLESTAGAKAEAA